MGADISRSMNACCSSNLSTGDKEGRLQNSAQNTVLSDKHNHKATISSSKSRFDSSASTATSTGPTTTSTCTTDSATNADNSSDSDSEMDVDSVHKSRKRIKRLSRLSLTIKTGEELDALEDAIKSNYYDSIEKGETPQIIPIQNGKNTARIPSKALYHGDVPEDEHTDRMKQEMSQQLDALVQGLEETPGDTLTLPQSGAHLYRIESGAYWGTPDIDKQKDEMAKEMIHLLKLHQQN
eukprot:59978_1